VFLSLTGHRSEGLEFDEPDQGGDHKAARRPAISASTRTWPADDHRRPPPALRASRRAGHRLKWLLSDVATMTWRNLVALTRIPESLFFATLQPIMFVLLFRFVFGGAISTGVPGVTYVDFLMPASSSRPSASAR